MSGRVLVLGANGFIGSHVAAGLSAEGWTVRAGARRIAEPARRAPAFDWAAADFARLTTAEAWAILESAISGQIGVPPMLCISCRSTALVVWWMPVMTSGA